MNPWATFALTLKCVKTCDPGFLQTEDGSGCVLPPVPCPTVTIAGRVGFNSGINGNYERLPGLTNNKYAYDHTTKGALIIAKLCWRVLYPRYCSLSTSNPSCAMIVLHVLTGYPIVMLILVRRRVFWNPQAIRLHLSACT